MEPQRAKKPTDRKDIILRVKCYVPNFNNPKPTLKYFVQLPTASKLGGGV